MYFQTILLFRLLEKISLKNISAKEESEEADEFHDSQKCLRQISGKTFFKKIFMDFVCFSNLRARFSAFFSAFFYSFLSAVITKEIFRSGEIL